MAIGGRYVASGDRMRIILAAGTGSPDPSAVV